MHRVPWLLLVFAVGGCRCEGRRETTPPAPARALTPAPSKASAAARMAWISLPAGAFSMGRDGGDDDEAPAHQVQVPAFQMNRTEVTVGQYRRCVAAGACVAPATDTRCNWGTAGRTEHPVNCLTWEQARSFCAWAGGALASEAQWEFAARSAGKAQRYPWGDAPADCQRAVMPDSAGPGCGADTTAPTCSRPGGDSAQGLCDLSGNVWEWVSDCWHKGYGGAPVDGSARLTGCKEPGRRVVRGSSFLNGTVDNLRAASRDSSPAAETYHSIGLRCVRPAL